MPSSAASWNVPGPVSKSSQTKAGRSTHRQQPCARALRLRRLSSPSDSPGTTAESSQCHSEDGEDEAGGGDSRSSVPGKHRKRGDQQEVGGHENVPGGEGVALAKPYLSSTPVGSRTPVSITTKTPTPTIAKTAAPMSRNIKSFVGEGTVFSVGATSQKRHACPLLSRPLAVSVGFPALRKFRRRDEH